MVILVHTTPATDISVSLSPSQPPPLSPSPSSTPPTLQSPQRTARRGSIDSIGSGARSPRRPPLRRRRSSVVLTRMSQRSSGQSLLDAMAGAIRGRSQTSLQRQPACDDSDGSQLRRGSVWMHGADGVAGASVMTGGTQQRGRRSRESMGRSSHTGDGGAGAGHDGDGDEGGGGDGMQPSGRSSSRGARSAMASAPLLRGASHSSFQLPANIASTLSEVDEEEHSGCDTSPRFGDSNGDGDGDGDDSSKSTVSRKDTSETRDVSGSGEHMQQCPLPHSVPSSDPFDAYSASTGTTAVTREEDISSTGFRPVHPVSPYVLPQLSLSCRVFRMCVCLSVCLCCMFTAHQCFVLLGVGLLVAHPLRDCQAIDGLAKGPLAIPRTPVTQAALSPRDTHPFPLAVGDAHDHSHHSRAVHSRSLTHRNGRCTAAAVAVAVCESRARAAWRRPHTACGAVQCHSPRCRRSTAAAAAAAAVVHDSTR